MSPPSSVFDPNVEVVSFDKHLDTTEEQYRAYVERLGTLMTYYSTKREDEILTGNI